MLNAKLCQYVVNNSKSKIVLKFHCEFWTQLIDTLGNVINLVLSKTPFTEAP